MGEISVIGQASFARLEIVPEIQSDSGALDIRKRPFIWLSVCCLDAPFVAIAWQWLFADVFSIPLPGANTAALFFTAWFIYLIDRFADSVSLSANLSQIDSAAGLLRSSQIVGGVDPSGWNCGRRNHFRLVGSSNDNARTHSRNDRPMLPHVQLGS